MFEFLIGFLITFGVAVYISRKKDKEHRAVLIAIYDGDAEPDEYGNIGWVIK